MRRWTTSFSFEWSPIVTFRRRKVLFADWVEEHLEPAAFLDEPDRVGVAVEDRDLRVVVSRSGLRLEDGSAVGVEALKTAVEGALTIFEPKSIVLKVASLAWSVDAPSLDYDHARASFARRQLFGAVMGTTLTPRDGSALVDFESASDDVQADWGIVSATELLDRLANPRSGRVASTRPDGRLGTLDAAQLPAVSVFVDTLVIPQDPSPVDSVEGIYAAVRRVEDLTGTLARDLSAAFLKLEGDDQ